MSSALAIVQARTGSSRLPGKVLQIIEQQTMLERVLKLVARVVGEEHVVLAVPMADWVLGGFWGRVVYGKNEDVLSRFVTVAKVYPEYNTFVRFTADCPLLDVDVARWVIDLFQYERWPWPSSRAVEILATSPDMDGLDTEVFTRHALMEANEHATGSEREHVTLWMRQHLPCTIVRMPRLGPIRWSVDNQEGLDFVRHVTRTCALCAVGVPHHTNAGASIGGSDRSLVVDLHVGEGGGLVECQAANLLWERVGPQCAYTSLPKQARVTMGASTPPGS